jgi:DNA polymerase-3 subunit epsilon
MSNSNYVRKIISDYCVIDTETTGLSSYYDEIIEVGILKIRDGKVVDQYSQLIKPNNAIDDFITYLTGITNKMLVNQPSIKEVEGEILDFLGDDIIVGHNTSFDIRFLNASFKETLKNEYMDTMIFSRKIYPQLPHHRLSDLAKFLNLANNQHRALADCITTYQLYETIKSTMDERGLKLSDLWQCHSSGHPGIDIKAIKPKSNEIDEDNFFYGKHVVFTGKLEKMLRKDAMQIIVDLGGILDKSVNKNTNYLILGNNDYNAVLHGEKSNKHKKAEKLKMEGNDINI